VVSLVDRINAGGQSRVRRPCRRAGRREKRGAIGQRNAEQIDDLLGRHFQELEHFVEARRFVALAHADRAVSSS
jgi:hypothetical protein